jgi:hypothetical protein
MVSSKRLELNPQAAPQPSGGRFKQRIVAKETEEFQVYGQQIAALGKQYSQLDLHALDQAYQRGDISMQPNGAAGTISLIVKNYLRQGNSVTLVFNQQQKALQAVQVTSCLTAPSDAVTIAVQFAKLPDGTNHVSTNQVNGVSKQLGVMIQTPRISPWVDHAAVLSIAEKGSHADPSRTIVANHSHILLVPA